MKIILKIYSLFKCCYPQRFDKIKDNLTTPLLTKYNDL